MQEGLSGNRLLRLARRSNLGLGRRSSVFSGHETPIRARKGSGLAEISAMQGVAPPEALRRVSLEIDFSGLRGGAISALVIDQGCLRGPKTRIRAGKTSADAEISVLQGRTTHRNQFIHIFLSKVARYFLADSCLKSPSKS